MSLSLKNMEHNAIKSGTPYYGKTENVRVIVGSGTLFCGADINL